jgi:hypothetical protein
MEKPSTTEGHQSDATSRYSRDGTPDPTENSGKESEREGEGRQGEDGTRKVAELVKAILDTAWKDSDSEVQMCLQETLQGQGPDAVSGADWQWQYSAPLNEHSRLSRDLSDPPVTVGGIGTPVIHRSKRSSRMRPCCLREGTNAKPYWGGIR